MIGQYAARVYPAVTGDPYLFDRWRWLRRHLRPGPLRTLDAGCGAGTLSLYAAARGNQVVGISFDERLNALARRRATRFGLGDVRFLTADLRRLDHYGDALGHFDQVICFETIEHILDDAGLLAQLASLLLPNGRLLLTTPFAYHRRAPGEQVSLCEDGRHVRWGYTHTGLATLLRQAGLRPVVEEYLSGAASQAIDRLEHAVRWRIPQLRRPVTLGLRPLQLIDGPLTRFLQYPPYSVAIVASAEEPEE